jgi:hypothetical protein
MSDPVPEESLRSKHLSKYWALVGLYGVAASFLIRSIRCQDTLWSNILFAALILGPAFSYPISYYANKDPDERRYVKRLSEMWAPAWVALSAIWLAVLKHGFEK